MKSAAVLVGYNASNRVVYQETLSLGDYYDGKHLWDDAEAVRRAGLVRLLGLLYDEDGSVYQSFDSRFSAETGEYLGGPAYHREGRFVQDGVSDAGMARSGMEDETFGRDAGRSKADYLALVPGCPSVRRRSCGRPVAGGTRRGGRCAVITSAACART